MEGLKSSVVTFSSVGRLVWLKEVEMAWFVGVLGLGMTRIQEC